MEAHDLVDASELFLNKRRLVSPRSLPNPVQPRALVFKVKVEHESILVLRYCKLFNNFERRCMSEPRSLDGPGEEEGGKGEIGEGMGRRV